LDFLLAIETLPPVRALKLSFVVYPLVNALHIMGFATLVVCVSLMDLKIIGAIRVLDRDAFVTLMRRFGIGGFVVAAATGLLMFAIQAREYTFHPAFQVKMALLLLAGLNLLAFRYVVGEYRPGRIYPFPARLLAVLSIVIWIGVILAGRFIGFL
jgi:hypothetical protein